MAAIFGQFPANFRFAGALITRYHKETSPKAQKTRVLL